MACSLNDQNFAGPQLCGLVDQVIFIIIIVAFQFGKGTVNVVFVDVAIAVYIINQFIVLEYNVKALVVAFVLVIIVMAFGKSEFNQRVSGITALFLGLIQQVGEFLGGFTIVHEFIDPAGQPSESVAHGMIS
jgi:hypothetical protein